MSRGDTSVPRYGWPAARSRNLFERGVGDGGSRPANAVRQIDPTPPPPPPRRINLSVRAAAGGCPSRGPRRRAAIIGPEAVGFRAFVAGIMRHRPYRPRRRLYDI